MAVAQITLTLQSEIQKVWNVVTSLTDYAWRSDLSKIEVLNDKQFVEYTKDGYSTSFTVTHCEPGRRWEFDMENENMKGHWSGVFTDKNGQTELCFTENVEAKKLLLKPFVKAYLKRQQAQYTADLEKALR